MKKAIAIVFATLLSAITAFSAVSITTSAKTFEKNGGAASIVVAGDGSWTATSDVGWLTIAQGASGDGAGSCVYIVNANTTADTRIGHITLGGNTFTVTQYGYAATLSPANATFDRRGGCGTVVVTVDAGISWTAVANDDWIDVTPASGVSVDTVSYTVAEYFGVVPRVGSVTIGGRTFTITQNGVDVVIQPESTHVEAGAGIVSVVVTALANTHWTVTPNAPWISVIDKESGYGDYVLTLAVNANPSFERRTGTVTIGSATLSIVQEGTSAASLSINPTEATAPASGAYGNIAVYATPDAPWTAESFTPWITVSEGAEGTGNGNIKYVVSANPTLEEREGKIVVTPPYKASDPDLYRGLVFWIKEQNNIEGNDRRSTTLPLSRTFDGSFNISLSGQALPDSDDQTFTLAVSFKFSEINRVNRLFALYRHNFYFDENNVLRQIWTGDDPTGMTQTLSGISADTVNKWYTIVYRHGKGDYETSYFFGEMGKALPISLTPKGNAHFYNDLKSISNFKFGYTAWPSEGNLTGGQIANIRFWNRALSDDECKQVDSLQGFPLTNEDKPLGTPSGVAWDYFPLNMNGLRSTHTNVVVSTTTPLLSDWSDSVDGRGSSHCAVTSTGNGKVTIQNFENMFAGSYTLNNGKTLNTARENYSYFNYSTSYIYYPYSATANSGSEVNASYSTWVKVASYPSSGNATILKRTVSTYKNGCDSAHDGMKDVVPQSINVSLSLALTTGGKFILSGTGVTTTTFSSVMSTNEWHMVTMVGTSGKSIQVYLDGAEIGNVSSTMTLGYLPPVDQRYLVRSSGGDVSSYGSVVPCNAIFTLGGWNGAADGLTFYHAALTSAQVREIYNRQRPQKVYHTVTQGVQVPQLSETEQTAPAEGATRSVDLTLAQLVNWTAQSNADWLTITSGMQGAGSASISYTVGANPTVTSRTGTLTIAGKTLTVTQEGLWADVSCEDTSFGVESNSGFIMVDTEGAGQWTATTDASWIHLLDTAGNGAGSVLFVVDDYTTTTQSRSGTIAVAGKKVVISQQGYELSIDPAVAEIGSNAGAGQFGVAAPIDAVWEAIADCDWIRIIGARTGIGDGIIQYEVLDNLTGETRTGRIVVSGKTYTITQRTTLSLNTQSVGSGNIAGAGSYTQGARVELTAVPSSDYVFSHWSGDAVGVSNKVSVVMDSEKNVTAHFIPENAAQRLAEEKAAQGGFYTRDQIHAMELGNLVIDVDDQTGKARIGVQLMETSDLTHPDWKPVNVDSGDLDVGHDGTVGIKTPATGNAKFFKLVAPNQ